MTVGSVHGYAENSTSCSPIHNLPPGTCDNWHSTLLFTWMRLKTVRFTVHRNAHLKNTSYYILSLSHTHARAGGVYAQALTLIAAYTWAKITKNKISDYIRKFWDREMFSGFCLMANSEQETKRTLEIIIVWGILSGNFFFGWKTLPELDSLLPTEACWQNQKGPASDCRDWCLELCQVTIWFLAWAWKRWRVTHLQTARALYASKAAAAENGRCSLFRKRHRVSVNSGNFTFYVIFPHWLNPRETALNIVFCGGNSYKQSERSSNWIIKLLTARQQQPQPVLSVGRTDLFSVQNTVFVMLMLPKKRKESLALPWTVLALATLSKATGNLSQDLYVLIRAGWMRMFTD